MTIELERIGCAAYKDDTILRKEPVQRLRVPVIFPHLIVDIGEPARLVYLGARDGSSQR